MEKITKQKTYFNKFRRRDKSQNIVFIIYFVLFILFSFISLFPFIWCFLGAMKDEIFLEFHTALSLPDKFDLIAFKYVFNKEIFRAKGSYGFFDMLFNSTWQTLFSCFLNVFASVLVAYPIARYNFPGKKLIYGIIIFRITIPVIGSGAAQYLLFDKLSMLNNPKIFWLAWLSGFDLSALILYGYFTSISKTYSEAAYLDGANGWQVMWHAILPQAIPCIVALFITQVITKWNDYQTAMLYLPKYPNLAYGVYAVLQGGGARNNYQHATLNAAIIISAIPPIIIYALGQRLMLENMSIGGIKG